MRSSRASSTIRPVTSPIAFDWNSDNKTDLMKSSNIRSRLAFPDQINLPPVRENSQKALYPKKFGMNNFIKRLIKLLENYGVEFFIETHLDNILIENLKIKKISFKNKTFKFKKLLWSVGWPSLAKELNVDISDLSFELVLGYFSSLPF